VLLMPERQAGEVEQGIAQARLGPVTASRCPAASCTTPTADGPGTASARRAPARGS
jgi:hypothetical protein